MVSRTKVLTTNLSSLDSEKLAQVAVYLHFVTSTTLLLEKLQAGLYLLMKGNRHSCNRQQSKLSRPPSLCSLRDAYA